jgi:hypothetical protein
MKGIEKTIRELSDNAFASHTITERMRCGVFRSWRCMIPGRSEYGFDITTIPGSLIITGDLGEMIVSRTYDMLPWCRGSVDSTDYFSEKVSREFSTKEFSRDKLRAWLADEIKERDPTEDIYEKCDHILQWEIDNNGEDWFYRELEDAWAGDDPPNWRDWTPGFLWKRDAIRWFVTHHHEPEVVRES